MLVRVADEPSRGEQRARVVVRRDPPGRRGRHGECHRLADRLHAEHAELDRDRKPGLGLTARAGGETIGVTWPVRGRWVGVGRVGPDAGSEEGGRVGPHVVHLVAVQEGGPHIGDGVEPGAVGLQTVEGELGPAVTTDHVPAGVGLGEATDLFEHRVLAVQPFERHADLAHRAADEVVVSVDEAGHEEPPLEVDLVGVGSQVRPGVDITSDERDHLVVHHDRLGPGRSGIHRVDDPVAEPVARHRAPPVRLSADRWRSYTAGGEPSGR